MIYCHELANVSINPNDAWLVGQRADPWLPAHALRKHALLMADIERVARWKFDHREP